MRLPELQVLHLDAAAFPLTEADRTAARAGGEAWVIDTCQRTVIVSAGRAAHERIVARLPVASRAQGYAGTEAYAFLLRFACGLESRLVGECEIFGQIKESWREFASAPNPLSRKLDGWVQRLFKDTKEVRAGPLSRLGSASYGSQVRRLLGDASEGPTLLVGAGQLAQAVAPWIETPELLLWNRTVDRAHELARLVKERHPQRACRVLEASAAAELEAWSRAGDVILCVPADEARDAARIAAWQARAPHGGRIVHLGLGESNHRTLGAGVRIDQPRGVVRHAQDPVRPARPAGGARAACVRREGGAALARAQRHRGARLGRSRRICDH